MHIYFALVVHEINIKVQFNFFPLGVCLSNNVIVQIMLKLIISIRAKVMKEIIQALLFVDTICKVAIWPIFIQHTHASISNVCWHKHWLVSIAYPSFSAFLANCLA